MTAQTPCECTGIKWLSPTMENIHIYPEKSQFTVLNSSPSFWNVVGAEPSAVEPSRPGGFSELDFPQDRSVCTLKKFTLRLLTATRDYYSLFVLRWWVLPAVHCFLQWVAYQILLSFLDSTYLLALSKKMSFPITTVCTEVWL